MNSNYARSILFILGSFFLVVSFQNCGQAGTIAQVSPDTQKISEPLVVDVVNQIGVDQLPVKNDEQTKEADNDKDQEQDDVMRDDKKDDQHAEEDYKKDDPEKDQDDTVAVDDKDKTQEETAVVDDKDKDSTVVVDDKDKDGSVVVDDKKEDMEVIMDAYACFDRGNSKEKKVMICHVPSGNPNARHTICISKSALKAHMNHGHQEHEDQDHLGECR